MVQCRVIYGGATEPLIVDQDWWWPDDAEKILGL